LILLERLAPLLGYGLLAGLGGLGLATALMLATDADFRRAFVRYWRRELS